ncbi:MAG TPA: TonB-dependent receptor [Quisquiliibacterium sp.]|nr:TonB-dependent receptor [Quisquiliibacterium sp.]
MGAAIMDIRNGAAPVTALLLGLGSLGGAGAQEASTPATGRDKELPAVQVQAGAERESGKESLRATTTSIGKGNQELRDIPQSLTVVTEKLLDDRNLDTLKDALKQTAGVAFQAAEGSEEDIRLRGFSLQGSGDIFIDGIRDPAFYERDSFNWDRLELLRGSASMLFGRGSTGGAVNQVTKKPFLSTQHLVDLTLGSGNYRRALADLNFVTGENAALRINAMVTRADNYGVPIDRIGIAPTLAWGIGTQDEFQLGLYHLESENGIHYGLPWLTPGANKGGDYLWKTDPRNYYGAASDYTHSGTTQGNFTHIHRFDVSRQLKTSVRVASYERDQRASAIRFAGAASQPGGLAVTSDTFSDLTVLNRGSQNKIMDMNTVYAQSDYSGKHDWFGRENSVQAGIDFANEDFENYAASLPAGTTMPKPPTTVGTPNDGGRVDESMRNLSVNRTFDAQAVGLYAQDLIRIADHWKLLGGLRWDVLEGKYSNLATTPPPANNPCAVTPNARIERSDSLLSQRFGVLYQPTALSSFHLSYGTSYNTAGDTYQYDAGNAQVDPEKSRNIELGGKFDSESGDLSTRVALFHSTKYNERNRDADTVNACNYVLSGQRHAAGIELDVAGRITPQWEVYVSYAFIPVAEVDSSSGAAGTEAVGSRPGLTPKHTASIWTTYQATTQLRVGGGITARSSDTPVGLPAGSPIEAPAFVTGELMAEYLIGPVALKANLTNITDKHYADFLYRGHYVPGRPRTLMVTAAYRF